MTLIPESHRDLLIAPGTAALATIGPDGFPQVTAVWYLVEDEMIKVSVALASQKVRNLRRRPECSMLFLDPVRPERTIEVRGRTEITLDDDLALFVKINEWYGNEAETLTLPDYACANILLYPLKVATFG